MNSSRKTVPARKRFEDLRRLRAGTVSPDFVIENQHRLWAGTVFVVFDGWDLWTNQY